MAKTATKIKTAPTSKSVEFVLEKETAGAVRYKEVDDDGEAVEMADALIGTLYLRKSKLGKNIPDRVTVTVDFG